jgi:hypothetical protein
MSKWTEYNSTMEWPEGDNFEWEVRLDGAWHQTDTPLDDWETGMRVRYCITEVKTREQLAKGCAGTTTTKHQYMIDYRIYSDGWQVARKPGGRMVSEERFNALLDYFKADTKMYSAELIDYKVYEELMDTGKQLVEGIEI